MFSLNGAVSFGKELFTIMENETTKILGLDQNSSKENVNESRKTKDEKR